MAVKLFFGLPGAGKTTLMAYFAKEAAKKKSPYTNVYSNVRLGINGVTYIDNECVGKYNLENGLILIDEATLFADNRAYKEFGKDKITYFLEHRHYKVDIYLFTQQWDGVDRKIRVITDRVYYVYKGHLLGKWFTSYYRIPYGIIIPDPNKKGGTSGEKLGEIIQGYCKPPLLVRLLAKKLFRPKYYKYFDSWERPVLPELPERYQPYKSDTEKLTLKGRFSDVLSDIRRQLKRRKLRASSDVNVDQEENVFEFNEAEPVEEHSGVFPDIAF